MGKSQRYMIEELFGGNEPANFDAVIGKRIADIRVIGEAKGAWWREGYSWETKEPKAGTNGKLVFTFDDGFKLAIWDNGQSCCEDRFLHTDDDLSGFVGAEFLGAEMREMPDIEDGTTHEVAFCIVKTSKGEFTVETHNVHNGYYGGFVLTANVIAPDGPTE